MTTEDPSPPPVDGGEPAIDIYAEAKALKARSPPYQSPKDLRAWKPVDVYLWLESPEVKSLLGVFSKPFAETKIGGFDLIRIVQEDDVFLGTIVVGVKLRSVLSGY